MSTPPLVLDVMYRTVYVAVELVTKVDALTDSSWKEKELVCMSSNVLSSISMG